MSVPTVVIVGADKGGVGKTTLTRAVLDYLKVNGIEYRAFDTEAPDGVLKRFFADKTEIVDLTRSDGQMTVFDTLQRARVTVIDVRAGLLTPTLEMLRDIGLLEAVRDGKIRLVLLHVLGAAQASQSEIKATGEILAGCQHFLVKNHINNTDYFGWDVDLSAAIDIPKLDELAMEHVDKASVPFQAYEANLDNSFVIRGKVRKWLGQVFAALAPVKLDQ